MLELNNLSHSINGKIILKEMNLLVNKNTIVLFKGDNGIGKTTLLKCIVGLYKAHSGSVILNSKENPALNCFGYMPSSAQSFFDNLTGRENIDIFLGLNKITKPERDKFLSFWENENIFQSSLNTKLINCSDGMRQKLNFIRSLIGNRDFLILDEPFKSLDTKTEEFICKMLNDIKKEKVILISSHKTLHNLNIDKVVEL